VHDQIAEVLSLPESGSGAPTLARLEDVLTEGYAYALALEAERWRIERRLGEVVRVAGDLAGNGVAQELASLSERLTSADGELSDLRALLDSLRDRTRAARAASCAY
jgi:hypothetical protein